ncbi:MAG: ADP-forming succinate--CoA ligase subunit beta [Candidatus Eisenbacteria sp.]|nr:ADP-forming succinate--CoA ligase subunit beta [Candidatus Eisenbacteria bacterium]
MNIHEYQAKEIFGHYGIRVHAGKVVRTAGEAGDAAQALGGRMVIKAQVHAGGRGKAGGIKLADTWEEAREKADGILGLTIKGIPVRKVFVTPAAEIGHEYYLGAILDREARLPMMMVSREGGIDIEEVAAKTPEKIHKLHFDPYHGLRSFQARELAHTIEPDGRKALAIAGVLVKLSQAFLGVHATLAEINPLVELQAGGFLALDAKINLDDSAVAMRSDLEALRDPDMRDDKQDKAREFGLSFIPLEGNIGCVVNGAGLAMATMDLVKHFGGDPANFLDIGGSSSPEKVVTALEIITADPRVQAILFNIFGGITRCDHVAEGIVTALRETKIDLPIVVRLTGTNAERGRKILEESGAAIFAATMEEAVQEAIRQAGLNDKGKRT